MNLLTFFSSLRRRVPGWVRLHNNQRTNRRTDGWNPNLAQACACMPRGKMFAREAFGTIGRYRTSPLGVSSHETFQQSEKDRSRALGVNHKPVFDGGWHISVHGFRSKPGRPGRETSGKWDKYGRISELGITKLSRPLALAEARFVWLAPLDRR